MTDTQPDGQPEIAADAGVKDGAPAPTPLETALADATKFRELALRSQAELDNFRKRMVREKEESIRYANSSVLEKILPVLDNFELGLQAAGSATDAAGVLKGMEMVHKQLRDLIRDQSVEEIAAAGQPFDPNLHEAVAQEHSDTVPEGHISSELRRGYRLKYRLLRPSTVVVSKGPAPAN